jgi:hypothetical protein
VVEKLRAASEHKHRRGSFDSAQDRLFDSAPQGLCRPIHPCGASLKDDESVEEPEEKQQVPFDFAQGRLSTALRSGRDDKFV